MTTQKLTVEDALLSQRPFFVIFKSEGCMYCHALSVAIKTLQSKYAAHLDFYFLDVDEEDNILEIFDGQITGVPSIILVFDGEYVTLPEPSVPDPYMWYTLSHLEEFIKNFLRGEDA